MALRAVYRKQFGDTVNVVVPMGYPTNNRAYIDEVRRYGLALFSAENLAKFLAKNGIDAYLALLRQCDPVILFLPANRDSGRCVC